ncbi:MAG: hypothetical protein AVDCRST_MAG56-6334 [uncultured Cytophagales bacterium]|uniref:DUF3667 domain-containing protein n=1 Tax=uncultured Cytophagales bacterium TaxID=158755 RepID=A0A6J4KPU0_9SPHI|nr:MAG: hypothetical protein AVDCRST_MAG56-6334 [uncultured Cytophagales bacterium]
MATADVECKNCAARFAAATGFCSRCGQALAVERLTFRKLLADAAHQLTDTDAGFWFTLRQLTRRPGAAVQEYLRGKRKAYTKPLQFYLVLLAVFFGLTELLHLDVVAIRYRIMSQSGLSWFSRIFATLLDPSGEDTSRQVLALFQQNIKVNYSLLVIMLGCTLWAGFRHRGFTLVEMVVLALYLVGYKYLFETAAMLVMITPLGPESRLSVGSALLMLSNGYLWWAIAGFPDKITLWSVVRALLLLLATGMLLHSFCLLIISL